MRLAKAYMNDCPSTFVHAAKPRARNWSLGCARIRSGPARGETLALDMVRLEWADIDAFDGKAEPALKPEDLAGADPETLRLRLQPYIHLLDLHYPVDDLLLEVRKDEEDMDFASNAFNERRKQKRVLAVARLKPSTIFLVVHRLENSVYFRRLEREEFLILKELRAGKTLSRAIDSALRKSSIAPEERPSQVQTGSRPGRRLAGSAAPDRPRSRSKNPEIEASPEK